MYQKTSVAALLVGLLVASSFVGAAAFTNASVDRSASIDVVNDEDGIIGLAPGSTSVVTMNSGELTIDAAVGDAKGINTEATMEIGDSANPSTTYAFNVTNNAGKQKSFEMGYAVSGTDSDASDDVTFTVYKSDGSQVTTISEESGTKSFTIDSGATYYVVVSLDTTGNPTGDDLSGTLTITAS